MLFEVKSFHSDGGSVKPQVPTFIEASTWYNARRVLAGELCVPVDSLLVDVFEGDLPEGAMVYNELDVSNPYTIPVCKVA